ncbi:MAG: tRNA pseudouridine(38-40) synthase TruA [Desulfonatronovibrio sp.]
MRVKLTLAYDGTGYHGWQLQKNQQTIQGIVEKSLARICSRAVRVHGSGRTDAGVHALGQTAHFDPPGNLAGLPWQKALNSLLPESIRIIEARSVNDNFHARYSAISKTYSYSLWTEQDFVLPQRRYYVWKTGPLNLQALEDASASLAGTHDFKAFMNKGTKVHTTWRRINDISFHPGLYPQELVIKITADGFLKQMVRNIVGALVIVGRGKYQRDYLLRILDTQDRNKAPATAPARGLCLENVEYPLQHSAH